MLSHKARVKATLRGDSPENFVVVTQAVHKYGRYMSLGKEAQGAVHGKSDDL